MTTNTHSGGTGNHFEDDIADLQKKLSEHDDSDWGWLDGLPKFTGKHTPPPRPFERMRGKDYGSWGDNSSNKNK